MVRILSYLAIVFIALSSLTVIYFQNSEIKNSCQIKVLTSNSFYNGAGKNLKSLYFQKYQCDLQFIVVNGANLITNLFLKRPNKFDVLIGLDFFQIQKMEESLLWKATFLESPVDKLDIDSTYYFPYDESPITFFVRKSEKTEFENLNMFLHYANANKISLAVPLKTTSVLGSLFDLWMKEKTVDSNSRYTQIKYAKSWSEAFGLFERKIVNGFLSFETSEIFYLNDLEIKKIRIKEGHPELKEYYAFSSKTNMSSDQKKNFYDFIKSEEVQSLILKKNYMWPAYDFNHEHKNLRNLNVIKLNQTKVDYKIK